MSTRATGSFEVQLMAQPAVHTDAGVGRMSIDKTFSGDLQGSSQGEMLSAMTAVKGSAAYVAIERVTGSLHGRQGSFVLQHTGVMDRGTPRLDVTVVPDSGTGELGSLAGRMAIDIVAGKHLYTFDYSLDRPAAAGS